MTEAPLLEARDIVKRFGPVVALFRVSLEVRAGEVHCLLGDNGAGKSTLIKTLSGVHPPTEGELLVQGRPVSFASPRDALDNGIATVFQDLALVPLMSIARNFFLGREPIRSWGPIRTFDRDLAARVTRKEMGKMGIAIRDPDQAVGMLSGGERQCIAIARAIYFGAHVLVLDEPTSALGVTQTAMVLKCIEQARARGLGVIFITHNVRHAVAVGDRFTVLNRGQTLRNSARGELSLEQLQELMAGGALPAAA